MSSRVEYNSDYKHALVLSGGGAKGAFQIAAVRQLLEEHGFEDSATGQHHFDIITGVSVGALNGALLAMHAQKKLYALWDLVVQNGKEEILTSSAIRENGAFNWWGVIWNALGASIASNKPLHDKLKKHIKLEYFKNSNVVNKFGAVDLKSGKYEALGNKEFERDEDFQNWILASSAMPIFWEPVEHVRSTRGNFNMIVDGGIRDNSPLRDAINIINGQHYHPELNPENKPFRIIIINCSDSGISGAPNLKSNMLAIATRSLLDIAFNEILRNDFELFLEINHLVREAKAKGAGQLENRAGKYLVEYEYALIEPNGSTGETLDFTRERLTSRMNMGRALATAAEWDV